MDCSSFFLQSVCLGQSEILTIFTLTMVPLEIFIPFSHNNFDQHTEPLVKISYFLECDKFADLRLDQPRLLAPG